MFLVVFHSAKVSSFDWPQHDNALDNFVDGDRLEYLYSIPFQQYKQMSSTPHSLTIIDISKEPVVNQTTVVKINGKRVDNIEEIRADINGCEK